MNDEFEIISQARVPSKIDLATFNNSTGEIITFSNGYVVVSLSKSREIITFSHGYVVVSLNKSFILQFVSGSN